MTKSLEINKLQKEFLFIPFLDKEYQIVKGLNKNYDDRLLIDELYLLIKYCILLCDKGVIVVPAFLAESNLTYKLFELYDDLWLSKYLYFVIKESDKKDYIEKKQSRYKEVKNFGYKGYYDKNICEMIYKSQFPLLSKRSSSEFMKKKLHKIFKQKGYLRNLYKSKSLDTIVEVVQEPSIKPFVWELLSLDLEKHRLLDTGTDFRSMFSDLYIESNTNENIAVISGWKFVMSTVRYKNFSQDIYNVSNIESILSLLEIRETINSINILVLERFKDTPEFTIFKNEYFKLVWESENLESLKLKISQIFNSNNFNIYKNLVKRLKDIPKSNLIFKENNMPLKHKHIGFENIKGNRTTNATILFMDIVGFSKENTSKQLSLFYKMRDYINVALKEMNIQKVICLSTGDGACLIFEDKVEILELCAIFQKLIQKDVVDLKLRIGINFGEINIIEFENNTANAIGHNVNIAARVMDIGDENHILLSNIFYGAFIEKGDYSNSVHYVGEYEIKHGDKLTIYNFYQENVGNKNIPIRLNNFNKQ